jgi:hypothetical protein
MYGWADKGCCGDDTNETFASYLKTYCCRGTTIQEADPCDYNGDGIYEFVNYKGYLRGLKPPKIVAVLVNSSVVDLNSNVTVTLRIDNTAGNSTNIPNTTTITASLGNNLQYVAAVQLLTNITNSSVVDVNLILKAHEKGVSQITPYLNFTFDSKKVVADSAFAIVNVTLTGSYVNKYFETSEMRTDIKNVQGNPTTAKGAMLILYKLENSVLKPIYIKNIGDFTDTYNYTIDPATLHMDCGTYVAELRIKTEGYYSSGASLLTVTGCYQ